MTKFNRFLMALFAIVTMSLTTGCGGSNPGGPSDIPTPPNPARLVIAITIHEWPSEKEILPVNGIVQMPANQSGLACTRLLAVPQVPDRMFEATITYWPGMASQVIRLTRNTSVVAGARSCDSWASAPKGPHQIVAQFTERGGDIPAPEQQTITARVNFN